MKAVWMLLGVVCWYIPSSKEVKEYIDIRSYMNVDYKRKAHSVWCASMAFKRVMRRISSSPRNL